MGNALRQVALVALGEANLSGGGTAGIHNTESTTTKGPIEAGQTACEVSVKFQFSCSLEATGLLGDDVCIAWAFMPPPTALCLMSSVHLILAVTSPFRIT